MLVRILIITIILIPVILKAQEPVINPLPKEDTLKFNLPELYQPGLDFSGSFTDLSLSGLNTTLNIPAFDFSDILQTRWQIDYSILRFAYFPAGYFLSPFQGAGMMFNRASWKASPKLTLVGSSFGIHSLFRAPLPGTTSGNYPVRGMSVFMEYKISPNLRIGGGITVTGHQP